MSGTDASQWRLTWRRFRRHRLAVICGVIILLFYAVVAFAEFFATTDPNRPSAQLSLVPPQEVHFFDHGTFHPFVYKMDRMRDANFKLVYTSNTSVKIPVTLFAKGFAWKLFGLIPMDRHLIGVEGADAGLPFPSRYRRAGPRPVVAHRLRHPCFVDGRSDRRPDQPDAGRAAGRHLRSVRRRR